MDDLRGALGLRIKELRERQGLSQEQLAERANLHVTYISGIERGRRNPGLNNLAGLARALRTPLPSLVSDLRPNVKVKVRDRGRPLRGMRRG